ncbi:hypothetical protein D3C73_1461160 [compost metagenome]
MRTRIQSGLRGNSSVGMIFTGIRATLSAPRSLVPTSTLAGWLPVDSTMAFMVFSLCSRLQNLWETLWERACSR